MGVITDIEARHKHIERQTAKIIEAEMHHVRVWLGAPGSLSRGTGPAHKAIAREAKR